MRTHIQRPALALLGLAAFILPQSASAGAGAQALAQFINDHILIQAIVAFEGVAAIALFAYGFMLVVNASKDSSYTEAINSFVNAAVGFAVLAISGAFVNAFYMQVNPAMLIPGINSITDYIVTGASGVFVLMITIVGIRMLSTQGDSGELTKARGLLLSNSIGLAITLMAKPLVFAVSGNNPGILIAEMRGLAEFLLTIVGTVCVCAIVVAGSYLIISVDESYKDRAKKTIIGTLIALGVVLSSYTLIITFV